MRALTDWIFYKNAKGQVENLRRLGWDAITGGNWGVVEGYSHFSWILHVRPSNGLQLCVQIVLIVIVLTVKISGNKKVV